MNYIIYDQSDITKSWYTYSDNRFNGLENINKFKESFPNLASKDFIKERTKSLEDILEECSFHSDQDISIELTINQSNALIILKSSKSYLINIDKS